MIRQFTYIHGVAGISLLSGKKYKCDSTVFLYFKKLHQETLIIKTTVFISYAQDSQWATKRAKKNFNATTWAYRPKPPLHGLSLKKSPIKNHATLFQVESSSESNTTRLYKAQHLCDSRL